MYFFIQTVEFIKVQYRCTLVNRVRNYIEFNIIKMFLYTNKTVSRLVQLFRDKRVY